jgi:glycosyltransferase involved in cell wall biosynthesis
MSFSRPVKVVHMSSAHPARDIRIFYKECCALAQAGFKVTLVADHPQDELAQGISIKAVAKPRRRLERMTKGIWQVYREAVKQKGDIYHFHDPELIPIGLLLRLRGKKVIYDIHEDMPRDVLSKSYLPRWVRKPLAGLVEMVENASARRFSALVPATPMIAARFQTLNPNTVTIHNYAIVPARREKLVPWNERPWSVAYAGLISRERGIVEIIRALELLAERRPIRLTLAGRFSSEGLRAEVSRLPGWQHVDYLGVLDPLQVPEILERSRAGLVTLHPEPQYLEALPIKLFEYMSAAIPVVVSDFPLWRQIVETARCGMLVDPLNAQQIARALEYLASHEDVSEAMGSRGRTAVEKQYCWSNEARKLVDLYENLVGRTAERAHRNYCLASFR